jgi:hypothetical protein
LLVSARDGGASAFRAERESADPLWRRIGAMSLTSATDREERARALRDPSPLVRQGAALAAEAAHDARDTTELRDMMLADPDRVVRHIATTAWAHSVAEPNVSVQDADIFADQIADALPRVDAAERRSLAFAWLRMRSRSRRAQQHLQAFIGGRDGEGELMTAYTALVIADAGFDGELISTSRGRISSCLRSGDAELQVLAARLAATLTDDFAPDLEALTLPGSINVQIAANVALANKPAHRAAALARLWVLAGSQQAGARGARVALASLGERKVQAWLEADLASGPDDARLAAVRALGALGRSSRALPLLTDPQLRVAAACAMLAVQEDQASLSRH